MAVVFSSSMVTFRRVEAQYTSIDIRSPRPIWAEGRSRRADLPLRTEQIAAVDPASGSGSDPQVPQDGAAELVDWPDCGSPEDRGIRRRRDRKDLTPEYPFPAFWSIP